MGFFLHTRLEKGTQKQMQVLLMWNNSPFLECLKFSQPVEAEAGVQPGQRLCAFPVTPEL